MKSIMSVLTASGLVLCNAAAEGKGNVDWAEQAAIGYEQKAVSAVAAGNTKDAQIYRRMAQIKRDAGAASKQGKKFSWKEYHELDAQLSHNDGGKKHEKKGDGGFEQTAKGHDIKAAMARELGNKEDAELYSKLAEIKRSAAKGELKNWDEYHKLSAQLSDHKKHADKNAKHKGKKSHKAKDEKQTKYSSAVADYQMKASKAMAAGNEDHAEIYTKLANMKKEAADAAAEGKGYDWTEYFVLRKELK